MRQPASIADSNLSLIGDINLSLNTGDVADGSGRRQLAIEVVNPFPGRPSSPDRPSTAHRAGRGMRERVDLLRAGSKPATAPASGG
jgi:hypothetical protein